LASQGQAWIGKERKGVAKNIKEGVARHARQGK
jgi:hypothetical protein